MNDDFLTRLRRPPRPAFAAALYQRISKPVKPQPAWIVYRRPALALAASLMALVLVVAAVPPARAWATTVLRQIGLISLVATASPPPAPDPNAPPAPTGTPIPADRPADLTTVEHVAAAAGFQPLLPAVLPDGYVQTDLGVMEYLDDAFRTDGLGSFLRYEHAAAGSYLDIQQSRFVGEAPREFAIGDVPIVDVTVRGRAGVWLAGLPNPGATLNMLLWWEDGFAFALQSDVLALDDLLAVAESLGQ